MNTARLVIEDDRGQFGPDERSGMRQMGYDVVPMHSAVAEPFSYTRQDTQFESQGGYNWKHDARITNIIAGNEESPDTADEAMPLIQERFGAVYKALSENMRRDTEVLFAATVESSGHALKQAPEDVVDRLPPQFFQRAMEEGVPDWVVDRHASEQVKADAAIQKMVAEFAAKRKASMKSNHS